jgi:hypothetical protein
VNKAQLKEFENFDNDQEVYLKFAWTAFTVHIDKPRGLWYAYNAKKYLDNFEIESSTENEMLQQIFKKGMGYHIVAMLYLWNNWFEEAFEIEDNFLSPLFWHTGKEQIHQYVEMLMIKRRSIHLGKLFDDAQFQYAFFTHFEVYYSLFINPEYTILKMNEFIQLLNKVNKLCDGYGEANFYNKPF